jgi:hypothetical protein
MPSDATNQPASALIWTWRPTPADSSATRHACRRGLLRGGLGLAVAALLALWKPLLGVVAAALALSLLAVAVASPKSLYPRLEGWLAAFARVVGLGVTWTTLTVVHVLVFLPLGLLLRAAGRLRLDRSLDPGASSYWRPADRPPAGPGRYERQF